MSELSIILAAAAIAFVLGCIAYRLSPAGRRNKAEIKRLREQLANIERENAELEKSIQRKQSILRGGP